MMKKVFMLFGFKTDEVKELDKKIDALQKEIDTIRESNMPCYESGEIKTYQPVGHKYKEMFKLMEERRNLRNLFYREWGINNPLIFFSYIKHIL